VGAANFSRARRINFCCNCRDRETFGERGVYQTQSCGHTIESRSDRKTFSLDSADGESVETANEIEIPREAYGPSGGLKFLAMTSALPGLARRSFFRHRSWILYGSIIGIYHRTRPTVGTQIPSPIPRLGAITWMFFGDARSGRLYQTLLPPSLSGRNGLLSQRQILRVATNFARISPRYNDAAHWRSEN